MAFCPKCGSEVAENVAYCPTCGTAQHAAAATPSPATSPTDSQMAENVAASLSYLLGWVTGLIFYFIDKRPFVRFHAAQSIVVFGGIAVIFIVLNMFVGLSMFAGGLAGAGFSIGFLL